METVVSKVLQLTATMAETVSHKRMAWYDQLVGLVLRNLASLVVAKQPGNSLGMVGLVLDNLTDVVVEQPGSSLAATYQQPLGTWATACSMLSGASRVTQWLARRA